MPITLTLSDTPSHEWSGASNADDGAELFSQTSIEDASESTEIFKSTFGDGDFQTRCLIGWKHGFVEAMYTAYCQHHRLTLRPEDIWFSILSQLNLYFSAHSQELRHHFVRPVQNMPAFYQHASVRVMANHMEAALANHVTDPELRAWGLPSFSTTTEDDAVTASVLMMGAITGCFQFTGATTLPRGLASVTLLGERADWEALLRRIDMIETWGEQPSRFAVKLRPILRRFVSSFDGDMTEILYFWKWCFREKRVRGEKTVVAGWGTAFCFWDIDGNCIPHVREKHTRTIQFDGVHYCPLKMLFFPAAYATLSASCMDEEGFRRRVRVLAGLVGFELTYELNGLDRRWDGLQPVSGWWVYRERRYRPRGYLGGTASRGPRLIYENWRRTGISR
ncbi:hypothetical protein ASPCADRAFT_178541 [Aspergillus carbonarius ITEM 5010]|uniref:Uncharacterized protein n=1 Tax=Aspergillus carbonarius (strain ITEM 5010) TaxID=602072 RepID=A0A1R3R8T8_ASPC5|nr:hypothetical protein ASPCADRAFT_178541 [Aspergillus carbonarius ITEM 5010]